MIRVSRLETPPFEDTKRIKSPEIRPKCFGTFEKQAQRRKNDIRFDGIPEQPAADET